MNNYRGVKSFASIIIPAHNEADNLPHLLARIATVISGVPSWEFEVIVINDGSEDNTASVVKQLQAHHPYLLLLNLSKNFGAPAAHEAGLWQARGDVVISLDGDCQHPPEMIPEMLEAYRNGADVVQMVRENRQAGVKGWFSTLFYRLYQRMAETEIVADGSEFRLVSRRIITVLAEIPERNKFMRALLPSLGFKQVRMTYQEEARLLGTPSYTFMQLTRLARKALFDFSTAPLKIVFYFGVVLAIFGACWAVFHLVERVMHHGRQFPAYLDVISVVFFMSGCILGAIGILGRYLKIVLEQLRGRPSYLISSIERPNNSKDSR